jgi:3-hydroxy acid dehydrogenase/malonic semialdehyde reductase
MCSGTEFSQVRFRGDQSKAAAVYEGLDALTAEDVAETVRWVATRPAHMNVNVLSLMPTEQAFAGFAVHRKK